MRGRRILAAVLSAGIAACAGEVTGGRAVPDRAGDSGGFGPSSEGDAAPRGPDCSTERTMTGDLIVGNGKYRWGGIPAGTEPGLSIGDVEGVTSIDGSLAIVGTELESLSALSCLREITGALHIGSVPFCMAGGCFSFPNTRLTSVQGLESLRSVGSQLVLAMSPVLRDIEALAGLEFAKSLHVTGLDSLESLRPLSRLTHLSDLEITRNPALESLDGLDSLIEVSRLFVSDNASLRHVDALSGLVAVSGQVTFSHNPALASLGGLRNVRRVGEGLDLTNDDQLVSLSGLGALDTIGGSLRIEECPVETLEGLSLVERAGGLHLVRVPSLVSVHGLDALTDLGGGPLEIRDAPRLADLGALSSLGGTLSDLLLVGPSALSSLTGLGGIVEVQGDLQVSGHPELSSVAALASLSRAGTVRIYGNGRLPACSAESLATALALTCEDPVDPLDGECTGLCTCPGNDGAGSCL